MVIAITARECTVCVSCVCLYAVCVVHFVWKTSEVQNWDASVITSQKCQAEIKKKNFKLSNLSSKQREHMETTTWESVENIVGAKNNTWITQVRYTFLQLEWMIGSIKVDSKKSCGRMPFTNRFVRFLSSQSFFLRSNNIFNQFLISSRTSFLCLMSVPTPCSFPSQMLCNR